MSRVFHRLDFHGPDQLTARALPTECPIDMPRAPVHRQGSGLRRWSDRWWLKGVFTALARLYVLVLTLGLAAFGAYEMHEVLKTGGISELQWVFLTLFAINFTWIAYAFTQASLGFFRAITPNFFKPKEVGGELSYKTAILLPVYNENPSRISAAIMAMAEGLAKAAPGRFAFFILSDTNNADHWIAEESVFRDLVEGADRACPVYYRHRDDNRERKAGNISDWVMRWGGAYDAMIVLDADSVISEQALVTLVRRLEADPGLGLIQTLPTIVRGRSLFGRIQQFANRCYGPIYGKGLAAWHGRSSNFWGHNAIIRTRAFAEMCRLPELRGKAPFGGHILSHDFVEAAFLRRAGWGVRMDTDIDCSYEEAPPSLVDVVVRDRRWCQGNMQHAKLLFARGLSWCTRIHFLTGILSYMSAAMWLALVVTGVALALQAQWVRPEYFGEPSLFPTWPIFDSERAVQLFIVSMSIVLAPKLFAWVATLVNLPLCRRYGGPVAVTAGVIAETALSVLYAPVMMLSQVQAVWSVLSGRDGGWKPQRRDDAFSSWADAWGAHKWHLVLGVVLGGSALAIDRQFFLWLSPVTAGLILAIPLSWLSGRTGWSGGTALPGLLRTPEERQPPEILQRLDAALSVCPKAKTGPALEILQSDPALHAWHLAQLKYEGCAANDNSVDVPMVVGQYKAERAQSLEQLMQWLTEGETLALLKERQFILTLPHAAYEA